MKTETAPGNSACAQRPKPLSHLRVIGQQTTAYSGLRKQFIALVSAQLLLLVGLAAPKAYTLCTGKVVPLQTTLNDPSDPFRGEYADLRFTNVSTVHSSLPLEKGDSVYVTLSNAAGKWTATSVSKEKPKLANQIAIKGKVDSDPYDEAGKRTFGITYGIEHFFVPQGRSSNLQSASNDVKGDKLIAEIAVDPSGDACIKRVAFKGTNIYDGTNMLNPFHEKQ